MNAQTLPLLPVRNAVLFPDNVMPLAVGRDKSRRLVDHVEDSDPPYEIAVVTQRDPEIEDPDPSDLYDVGTICRVVKILDPEDADYIEMMVKGLDRCEIEDYSQTSPFFLADVVEQQDVYARDPEEETLYKSLKETVQTVTSKLDEAPGGIVDLMERQPDAGEVCDFFASNLDGMTLDQQQEVLETFDVKERMETMIERLKEQVRVSEIEEDIDEAVEKKARETQREWRIRQKIKALKEEIGEGDDIDELEVKVDEMKLPERVEQAARKQINRLHNMQPSSSEYSVALNYVETLLDIPWYSKTDDQLDLDRAEETLEADHYGLEDVKDRILEQLAVQKLRDDSVSPIICLVGPPGTGKTSISKSIARTMGRKFRRVSLGGMYDESEIRGHRRTYVGAMPGKIVRAIQKTGVMNPVLCLDEIDKIGNDFRGDPEAALLEVLDPEQNDEFEDHYVETEMDLSDVFFITTANHLHEISEPLKDRMEIIEVPSYTNYEKRQIAKQFLVDKQLEQKGVDDRDITFTDESIDLLIERYTKEAGVRSLERRIGDVCRKAAMTIAGDEEGDLAVKITPDWVREHLGKEKYEPVLSQRSTTIGVATGMAYTGSGGDVLFVESQTMPGDGDIEITGSLGDVMRESVKNALSYLQSNHDRYGLDSDVMEGRDLHIHFPAGAVPKDGPSAGITTFASILSILEDEPFREDVSMTGEITLRGDILPVGGIKEKVTAAHRAGISEIILPEQCEKDLEDVSDKVKDDLTFHFVSHVDQVPPLVFEDWDGLKDGPSAGMIDDDDIEAEAEA